MEEYDPEGKYKKMYESGLADNTTPLSDVDASAYDVVFVVGGHGAMYDLAESETLHKIINDVYDNGNIVSAVCHGPAPLVFTKRPDGKMSEVANYTADEKVVWGNEQVLTGRDPFSAEALGDELVKALANRSQQEN